MYRIWLLFTVLATALVFSLTSVAVAQKSDSKNFQKTSKPTSITTHQVEILTQKLKALEPYVKYKKNGTQTIDTRAARRAGYSTDVVRLAAEIVAYQNAMLNETRKKGNRDIRQHKVPLKKFPKVKEFYKAATKAARTDKVHTSNSSDEDSSPDVTALARTRRACGDWNRPIPNYTPRWVNHGYKNRPARTLRNWGFHKTRFYACGARYSYTCQRDTTRPRYYYSRYGVCSKPLFRDHGRFYNHRVYVQYGEPNPEIFHVGIWPYWNWGAYVRWWHNNF